MKRIIFLLVFILSLYSANLYDNPARYPSSDYKMTILKYMATSGRDSIFTMSFDSLRTYLLNQGLIDSVSLSDSLSMFYTKTETQSAINDSLSQPILVLGNNSLEPKIRLVDSEIQHCNGNLCIIESDTTNISGDLEIESTLMFNDTTKSQILFRGYNDRVHGSVFSYPTVGGYRGFEISNAYHNGSDWTLDCCEKPLCYFLDNTNSKFSWYTADYGSGAVTNWDELAYLDTLGNMNIDGTFTGDALDLENGASIENTHADTLYLTEANTKVTGDLETTGQFYSAKTIEKPLYVTYQDTVLYVVQKFNSSRDMITTFASSGNNDLFTFKEVGLYNNSGTVPDRDLTRTRIQRLISNDGSDTYPCPIQVDGEFTGGNHLSPSTTHKTAWTASKNIYADGVELVSGYSGYYDELVIKTHNELLDPNDIESGYRQVLIDEYLTFRVKGHTIEVETEHCVGDTSFLCNNFYGMQEYGYGNADSVYFAHSDDNSWEEDTGTQNSGAMNTYPDCEKWILKDNLLKTAVQCWIDNSYSLPNEQSTYIDDTSLTYKIFQSSDKNYFHLIDNVTIAANTTYGLKGSYSFFDITEQEADNRIIASNMFYRNGQPVLSVDVLDTVQVSVAKELNGKTINKSYIDSDLSLGQTVFPAYIDIISNDTYGNCYLEVNPYYEDLYIEGNAEINGKTTLDGSDVVSGLSTNTQYGEQAGNTTGTGTKNTFIGYQVARNFSSAANNTVMGYQAGYNLSTGSRNLMFGFGAGQLSTTGADNTVIGYYALGVAKGNYNTAIGRDALYGYTSATSVDGNIAIGRFAGRYIGTGADYNIFIGYQCVDESNVTGSNNILIGKDLSLATTSTDSSLNIGGLITGDMTTATDDREVTIDGYAHYKPIFAKMFNDSGYTFTSADTWETIPFKEVYGDLNSPHFSYNADSTGIVISESMVLNPLARFHFAWAGTSTAATAHLRVVKGASGGRAYARCGQDVLGLNKTNNPNSTLTVCGTQGYAANDTLYIQGNVSDTDLIIKPDYDFANPTAGSIQIQYIGDY